MHQGNLEKGAKVERQARSGSAALFLPFERLMHDARADLQYYISTYRFWVLIAHV